MPSRMPIIPTSFGNRMLLRALHNEMLEKDFLKEVKKSPESSSSGIHSISPSDESDLEKRIEIHKRQPILSMPEEAINAPTTEMGDFDDSDSGSDDDSSSLERSYETGQSQSSNSSRENINHAVLREEQQHVLSNNKPDLRLCRGFNTALPNQNRLTKVVVASSKRNGLSEIDKQQIRDGYKRHVVNGERPSTGALFGTTKFTHFNQAKKEITKQTLSDDEVVFPLEKTAAGRTDSLDVEQARAIENAAKRKTKYEKQVIAEAKLSVADAKLNVAEAKLTEFEAKLRARQARIDERHAKLCRRRAIIKEAEERLQDLESRLDDEEEYHRERERRVKNRERRVKQEDAGIQIKEISLKRREAKITEDLKSIERRRKIVEEKEAMSLTMQDIMTKRENLYHQQQEKKSTGKRKFGTLTKLLRKQATISKDITSDTETLTTRKTEFSSSSCVCQHDNSSADSSRPVPTPRKSLKSLEISDKTDRKSRSNSLDCMMEIENDSFATRKRNKKADKVSIESLSRQQNKTAIMGLWL